MEDQPTVTPNPNPTPDAPQPVVANSVPPAEPQQHRPKRGLLVGLIVVVLLLAGAIGAYLIFHKNEQTGVVKHDIPHVTIDIINDDDLALNYPELDVETETSVVLANQVFESLVKYQDFTKVVPSLATGWSNPDASTWVFNLRPNVKFHTGRVMQASDVVGSLNELQKQDSIYTSTISSVAATNATTVTIKTDGPDPILLNKLAYAFIYDTQSKTLDDPVNGTGPYEVKPGTKPSEKRIDLAAFASYHGGHVYTRELSYVSHSNDQITKDIKANNLDFSADLTKQQVAVVPSTATYVPTNTAAISMLGARTTKPGPATNRNVRLAVAYALDKQAAVKALDYEAKPVDQLIPSQIPGYDPNITPITRNVTKAKQLLAEAGYSNGVTLSLAYAPETHKDIDVIVKSLAEAGITIQLQPYYDLGKQVDDIQANKVDLYLIGYSSSVIDGGDFLAANATDLSDFQDKAYLTALEDSNTEFDASKRLTLLQTAEKRVHDEAAIIGVNERSARSVLMHKNYVVKQDISGTNGSVYWWKVYADK